MSGEMAMPPRAPIAAEMAKARMITRLVEMPEPRAAARVRGRGRHLLADAGAGAEDVQPHEDHQHDADDPQALRCDRHPAHLEHLVAGEGRERPVA